MIYLVHADGALPNLALMRLSSYFKARGEQVRLVRSAGEASPFFDEPGQIYGSSIFAFSDKKREALRRAWGHIGPIRWGGTGVKVNSALEDIDPSVDWESIKPDYTIYPEFKASMDFSARGCRLKCKFCVVPEKEGAPKSVHTIADIYRGEPHPKKIMLLDNDFFGQPRAQWEARALELIDGRYKVSPIQGLNIREIWEPEAETLAHLEYRNGDFNRRVLYTAWDNLGDEKVFFDGVERLAKAGVPPKHLMVYMLIGFSPSETWERIHYRFNKLVAAGCMPYPMAYDQKRKDLKAFQRWAITGLYRAIPFAEYNPHIKRDRAAEKRAALTVLP